MILMVKPLFYTCQMNNFNTNQRDFDDFSVTHNSNFFWLQTFFFLLAAKNARILHKNDCERKLFEMVNENDTQ